MGGGGGSGSRGKLSKFHQNRDHMIVFSIFEA